MCNGSILHMDTLNINSKPVSIFKAQQWIAVHTPFQNWMSQHKHSIVIIQQCLFTPDSTGSGNTYKYPYRHALDQVITKRTFHRAAYSTHTVLADSAFIRGLGLHYFQRSSPNQISMIILQDSLLA